jgi:RimJ/RimL family protein N-acetyltransferase
MKYISNGRYNWTMEELKSKYQQMNESGDGFGLYIVELKKSKEVIGEAGLFNSFCQPEKAELGYIIDHKFWQQEYGTEVCNGLVRYAFDILNKHSVIARMYTKNTGSVRLCEKLGMVRIEEGLADNGETFYTYELK